MAQDYSFFQGTDYVADVPHDKGPNIFEGMIQAMEGFKNAREAKIKKDELEANQKEDRDLDREGKKADIAYKRAGTVSKLMGGKSTGSKKTASPKRAQDLYDKIVASENRALQGDDELGLSGSGDALTEYKKSDPYKTMLREYYSELEALVEAGSPLNRQQKEFYESFQWDGGADPKGGVSDPKLKGGTDTPPPVTKTEATPPAFDPQLAITKGQEAKRGFGEKPKLDAKSGLELAPSKLFGMAKEYGKEAIETAANVLERGNPALMRDLKKVPGAVKSGLEQAGQLARFQSPKYLLEMTQDYGNPDERQEIANALANKEENKEVIKQIYDDLIYDKDGVPKSDKLTPQGVLEVLNFMKEEYGIEDGPKVDTSEADRKQGLFDKLQGNKTGVVNL